MRPHSCNAAHSPDKSNGQVAHFDDVRRDGEVAGDETCRKEGVEKRKFNEWVWKKSGKHSERNRHTTQRERE